MPGAKTMLGKQKYGVLMPMSALMTLAAMLMTVLTAHAVLGCQATSSAGRQLQQGSSSSAAASARAGKRTYTSIRIFIPCDHMLCRDERR